MALYHRQLQQQQALLSPPRPVPPQHDPLGAEVDISPSWYDARGGPHPQEPPPPEPAVYGSFRTREEIPSRSQAIPQPKPTPRGRANASHNLMSPPPVDPLHRLYAAEQLRDSARGLQQYPYVSPPQPADFRRTPPRVYTGRHVPVPVGAPTARDRILAEARERSRSPRRSTSPFRSQSARFGLPGSAPGLPAAAYDRLSYVKPALSASHDFYVPKGMGSVPRTPRRRSPMRVSQTPRFVETLSHGSGMTCRVVEGKQPERRKTPTQGFVGRR